MTFKIAVTSGSFSNNKILVDRLSSYFKDIRLNSARKKFSEEGLIDFLSDCDAAIVGLDKIDKDILSKCRKLKTISKFGVGLDNINIKDCEDSEVKIGWTGGVNKTSVAEMALGFMLMLSRNLFPSSNFLKSGKWLKNGGTQISGKTVGIIGVGNIGKELIRLLKPFNCKIMGNDILNMDDYYHQKNIIISSKKEIYKNADIITIHTPLTEKTKHLINKDSLGQMKKTAFILNTARGGIVDEDDLYNALVDNIISGAAIDVYEKEPPENTELLRLPNLICTPHIGGNSYEAVMAMGESAIKNLLSCLNIKE